MLQSGVKEMIYVVNTERIQQQLDYLATCVEVLKEGGSRIEELEKDHLLQFALSRALHLAVESVIDVGDALIESYLMRDPGGYEDIIDIMEDEGVIPKEATAPLKERVRLRERLVRHYEQIHVNELVQAMKDLHDLTSFPAWVSSFMEREQERSGFKGRERAQ